MVDAECDDEVEEVIAERGQVVHAADANAVCGCVGADDLGESHARPLDHGMRGVERPHIEAVLREQDGVAAASAAEVQDAHIRGSIILRHERHEPMIGVACGEVLDHVRLLPEAICHGISPYCTMNLLCVSAGLIVRPPER